MKDAAHDLARRLGRQAEAVCRHYLSAGRRQGHYWQVGDVRNTPGRSMFVRLRDSAKGPAGKWTDAATGEHGDLLDVIRESQGLSHFTDVAAEAEMFLRIPRSVHEAQAPLSAEYDEPRHASSPTDHLLQELQLYGYRPLNDESDPRPLPEANHIAGAIADIFDALLATLQDTRLEPDLPDLLWSTVHLFHRAAGRISGTLDDNEQRQRRSQQEQDGSEVRSVELERLIAEGQSLMERRDTLEQMRDEAADAFERHTGSAWRPRTGSLVNHRNLTAALIDSRDFLTARRRSNTEVLMPAGPKIAFSGGDTADHRLIWAKLDQVHAKHPDMVLLHGGSPKGAERIAACWADARKVPQVAFKPDWTKHAKAAPFKRNDQMLSVMPIGVIIFPGTGIQDNLADKARKLGIPVYRFGSGGA